MNPTEFKISYLLQYKKKHMRAKEKITLMDKFVLDILLNIRTAIFI